MKILKKYNYIIIYFVLGIFFILITKYISYLYLKEVDFNLRFTVATPQVVVYKNTPMDTKIFFNNELEDKKYLNNIVEMIDSAKSTIDIVMFSFYSYKIRDAIYRASERGVKVTLVLDYSRKLKHDAFFIKLPKDIVRIDTGFFDPQNNKNAEYMHHKLLIIDKGLDNQQMITGSINYTDKGELYEQSFYLVTKDVDIIESYVKEFDFLKNNFYGTKKLKNPIYNPWLKHIKYTDSYLDIWMSPGLNMNSSKEKIIEIIDSSKNNINILMWQFTDKDIANILIKKAKTGVSINLIVDDFVAYKENSVISELEKIKFEQKIDNLQILFDTKLDNLIDKSKQRSDFSIFLHHHVMIVDNKIVVFGTNNWTASGFYRNDEDTLFTNNTYLVDEFQKTFDHFYKIVK